MTHFGNGDKANYTSALNNRSVTEPHTASEPSGQELVIVGMAGRGNGPPLSTRYDEDDDD